MSGDKGRAITGEPIPEQYPLPASSGVTASRDLAQVTLEEVLRPIGIAGMLTCLAISISQVIALLAPAWPGGFFAGLTFVVSLESIHAQRLVKRRHLTGRDKFRFRFVEWVVILLLVRFGLYARDGIPRLLADVASWSNDLGTFFDPGFIVTMLFMVLFWALALSLSQTMQELEASAIEKMPAVTDPGHYLRTTMPHHGRTDRQALLNRIVSIFFWGGVVLLVLTGLARANLREMLSLQHGRVPGVIANAFAYFLIGFLIISQAQYTILKANWELQGIPVLGKLGKRWLLLVIAFLLLIGLVSALLPVGYSVGIIETLSIALQWAIYIMLQVVFTILFLFAAIFGFLFSLFRGIPEQAPPLDRADIRPPPALPSAVAGDPNPWWQVLRSLLFWLILVSVVGYSLFHFVGDRWGLLQGLSTKRFFAWLAGLWRGLRAGTHRAATRVRQAVMRRLTSPVRQTPVSRRLFTLHRASPRERVRYFYLSILHRSAQQGFGRPPSMTPLEYERILYDEMPEVSVEVHELTEAFLEARYSAHEISPDEAGWVQRIWRQIKRVIKAHRRSSAASRSLAPSVKKDASR